MQIGPTRTALSLAAAVLAGCGSPPPPPPPTVVQLSLTAAQDANATTAGQGTPIVLRVYQLGSRTAFDDADFFALFSRDAATLKADLVKREDVTLVPGQTRALSLSPMPPVTAIGVFAGYRDHQRVAWRASAPVPPNRTTELRVEARATGVVLQAAPPPPPKPGA